MKTIVPEPPFALSDILLLGDPRLFQPAEPVLPEERHRLAPVAAGLADLILAFRRRYGWGRAIAAPQIGIMKRLIVLNMDEPVTLYNPVLRPEGKESITLWDDCMSFPHLRVRVKRFAKVRVSFRDGDWEAQEWPLDGDLSELLQHECDHLEGVLATMRAIDAQSFRAVPPSTGKVP